MLALPENRPDVYQVHLVLASFQFYYLVSTLLDEYQLMKLQVGEVTVNKDTQTPGDTTGFSLKPAALQQFYMTAEH